MEAMYYELRPDGRKVVLKKEDDKTELVNLPDVEFAGLPKKFREQHRDAMNAIYFFGEMLAEQGRVVPITREELSNIGVQKETLKDLERFALVETHIVELKNKGMNIGGRKVVVITPQGKALVKFFSAAAAAEIAEEQKPADPETALQQDQTVEPEASPQTDL